MEHLPIYNPELIRYQSEFSRFLKTKGLKIDGACNYATRIREFLFFIECKGITEIKEVGVAEIIAYHEYLSVRPCQTKEGGLSDAMIKRHLCALRSFFDFLMDIEVLDSSPARLPKFTHSNFKERNILTPEEILLLFSACESKRDRVIISLAYGCGMRRCELEHLDIGDVNFQKGTLVVRNSKFNKSRTIPMSDFVIKELKEYIIYERPKWLTVRDSESQLNERAFILNDFGRRKIGKTMNSRLKELVNKTNNFEIIKKDISLHCLRHSLATHLIDNGATIEFVRDYLGHSKIDTTQIYAKHRRQQMKILTQIR